MLTCVYHPVNPMQVVEEDEAQKLIASGFWFDNPDKAKQYRLKVENELKEEQKGDELKSLHPKAKQKGKSNER